MRTRLAPGVKTPTEAARARALLTAREARHPKWISLIPESSGIRGKATRQARTPPKLSGIAAQSSERFFYIATCSLFLQDQSDCRIIPDSRCRLTSNCLLRSDLKGCFGLHGPVQCISLFCAHTRATHTIRPNL